jgi:hypothetical protein
MGIHDESAPSLGAVDARFGFDMGALNGELRPLLDLWKARAADGGLPGRGAFTPRDLKPWLPAVHVYDLAGGGRFTARLLGTAIVQAIGADQTGRTFGPEDKDLLAVRALKFLTEVANSGKPVRSVVPRIASVKESWHAAESLWLPLGTGQTVQNVLAATILTELS